MVVLRNRIAIILRNRIAIILRNRIAIVLRNRVAIFLSNRKLTLLTLGCTRQSIQASLMLCTRLHESCDYLSAKGAADALIDDWLFNQWAVLHKVKTLHTMTDD